MTGSPLAAAETKPHQVSDSILRRKLKRRRLQSGGFERAWKGVEYWIDLEIMKEHNDRNTFSSFLYLLLKSVRV